MKHHENFSFHPILFNFITYLFWFWCFQKSLANFWSNLDSLKFWKYGTWQWLNIEKSVSKLPRSFWQKLNTQHKWYSLYLRSLCRVLRFLLLCWVSYRQNRSLWNSSKSPAWKCLSGQLVVHHEYETSVFQAKAAVKLDFYSTKWLVLS